jgi:hypothetical protein
MLSSGRSCCAGLAGRQRRGTCLGFRQAPNDSTMTWWDKWTSKRTMPPKCKCKPFRSSRTQGTYEPTRSPPLGATPDRRAPPPDLSSPAISHHEPPVCRQFRGAHGYRTRGPASLRVAASGHDASQPGRSVTHRERLWSLNIAITTRLVDTVTTPMLLKTVPRLSTDGVCPDRLDYFGLDADQGKIVLRRLACKIGIS